MSVFLVTDDEKNAVKQALRGAGLAEQVVASFDNTALECLHDGGYRTADKVNTAQRPGLERCKLLPADVDFLLTHLGRAPPGPDPDGLKAVEEKFEGLLSSRMEEQSSRMKEQNAWMKEQNARIEELQMRQQTAAVTTRTLQDIGLEFEAKTGPPGILVSLTENDTRVTTAHEQALAAFNKAPEDTFTGAAYTGPLPKRRREHSSSDLSSTPPRQSSTSAAQPGMSFLDACNIIFFNDLHGPQGLDEEEHMQVVAMKLLTAITGALKSDVHIADTHGTLMHSPDCKPDALGLADNSGVLAWSQVVYVIELKLGTRKTELDTGRGQLVQRCSAALLAQPQRSSILGILLTMNSIEVLTISREKEERTMSGQLPFSVHPTSSGFQLLVQILATPKARQGFQGGLLPVPALDKLGAYSIKPGSMKPLSQRDSSLVFCVDLEADKPHKAVLKLSLEAHEGDLLKTLQGISGIVKLLARGSCSYQGKEWHALLLSPYAAPLSSSSKLKLMAQVVHDVATAAGSAKDQFDILQCDITPQNMGKHKSRGILYDFSIGQKAAGDGASSALQAQTFTGTLMWAPFAVLSGGAHTLSSQLEGLFISTHSICSRGSRMFSETRRFRTDQLKEWAAYRLYQFSYRELTERERIEPTLLPLISDLHDLFWTLPKGGQQRQLNPAVSVLDVQRVCERHGAQRDKALGVLPPMQAAP